MKWEKVERHEFDAMYSCWKSSDIILKEHNAARATAIWWCIHTHTHTFITQHTSIKISLRFSVPQFFREGATSFTRINLFWINEYGRGYGPAHRLLMWNKSKYSMKLSSVFLFSTKSKAIHIGSAAHSSNRCIRWERVWRKTSLDIHKRKKNLFEGNTHAYNF